MTEQIVLPADVYDTYELSCEAYGGIGAGHFRDNQDCPLCLDGHAVDCDEPETGTYYMMAHSVSVDFRERICGNDNAIRDMIGAARATAGDRVPWPAYCAHRGIVRGT